MDSNEKRGVIDSASSPSAGSAGDGYRAACPGTERVYVDATVGLGGHSGDIITMIGAGGRLVGIDRDEEALREAGERLSDNRVMLRKGSFADMENLLFR